MAHRKIGRVGVSGIGIFIVSDVFVNVFLQRKKNVGERLLSKQRSNQEEYVFLFLK